MWKLKLLKSIPWLITVGTIVSGIGWHIMGYGAKPTLI
jgi:hypothetical protein